MKEVLETSAARKTTTTWREQLHKQKKNIISAVLFILLAALTFYAVFHGNDMNAVAESITQMHPGYLVLAIAAAIFFVSAEGMMIWYLLHALDSKTRLRDCIRYSFIGFFFSGITPSATGGQPAQLYYMKKDGRKLSESTVVLMTVAVVYKLVLVLMGIGMLLFAGADLARYLGKYLYLFYLGLSLNVVLVLLLLFVMIRPAVFQKVMFGIEGFLVRVRIWKPSDSRKHKVVEFVESYHDAVVFFGRNKHRILAVVLFTALQRISVFVLTYFIYRGFALEGTSSMVVILLQASVYIAVDMLPLPGAQGITELMYRKVFAMVFPGNLLTASMCVTRGLNFYLLLIISAGITLACYVAGKLSIRQKLMSREVVDK